jgi:hypothetical protein
MKQFTKEQVLEILNRNGIDADYLENNDNEIITGEEEWMDCLGEITGKDPYEDDFNNDDSGTIVNFINIIENELFIVIN